MAKNRGGAGIDQMSVAWSRGKLLFVFGSSVILIVALVAALAVSLVSRFWPGDDAGSTPGSRAGSTPGSATRSAAGAGAATSILVPAAGATTGPAPGQAERDELASRPMVTTDAQGFTPGPLSTREAADPITLPPGDDVDDHGVVTGFRPTPEGALAQLTAIEQAAVASGSLSATRRIIGAWAEPDGPTGADWTFALGMKDLFDSAGLPPEGSTSLSMKLTPSMAQIKGSAGPAFVVVCADYVLEIALRMSAMAAVADCQRMSWSGDRWLIGSGPQPFQATAVWPGTDAAIDAGWRDLNS